MVEQRTENPRVGGSSPPLGTILSLVFEPAGQASFSTWIVRLASKSFVFAA